MIDKHMKINFQYSVLSGFISVIIPVYRDVSGLQDTLNSIMNSHYPKEKYEIIIANDGADKNISELCEKNKVRCINIMPRRGSYYARNRALEVSRGEFIAFTDADVLVDDKWLDSVELFLRKKDYIVGRTEINTKLINSLADDYEHAAAFSVNQRIIIGSAVNFAVKRQVFERIGGFDERLQSGGDFEFGDRVARSKYKFIKHNVRKMIIVHPPRGHKQLKQRYFRIFKGKRDVLRFHPQCKAFYLEHSIFCALKRSFCFKRISTITKKMTYTYYPWPVKWCYVWYMEMLKVWIDFYYLKNREMKKFLVFYPMFSGNDFIQNTKEMLQEEYELCSLDDIWYNPILICKVRGIYINWLENVLNIRQAMQLIILKILNKRIIWVFNNKRPHESVKKKLDDFRFRFLARICDTVIILSKSSRCDAEKYVGKKHKEKIEFIEHVNYIDTYPLCNEDIRAKFNIPSDKIVFLLMGYIRPYKNIEVLIQSFINLNSDDCYLMIVGNPNDVNYAKQIRKIAERNSHIILDFHFIPNKKITAYLKAADVMVLPYNSESSINSGAMIMAFSYGVPVIISDIAMAKDFSNNILYRYHYSTRKEHINVLTEKMREAYLSGIDGNRRMGIEAKNLMSRNHNKERVSHKILEIVNK